MQWNEKLLNRTSRTSTGLSCLRTQTRNTRVSVVIRYEFSDKMTNKSLILRKPPHSPVVSPYHPFDRSCQLESPPKSVLLIITW